MTLRPHAGSVTSRFCLGRSWIGRYLRRSPLFAQRLSSHLLVNALSESPVRYPNDFALSSITTCFHLPCSPSTLVICLCLYSSGATKRSSKVGFRLHLRQSPPTRHWTPTSNCRTDTVLLGVDSTLEHWYSGMRVLVRLVSLSSAGRTARAASGLLTCIQNVPCVRGKSDVPYIAGCTIVNVYIYSTVL